MNSSADGEYPALVAVVIRIICRRCAKQDHPNNDGMGQRNRCREAGDYSDFRFSRDGNSSPRRWA